MYALLGLMVQYKINDKTTHKFLSSAPLFLFLSIISPALPPELWADGARAQHNLNLRLNNS
jgi:hypothetical protein